MGDDAGAARSDNNSMKRFRNFAWFVLAYNLLVILWGAFVRATGSGAGCGAHWPTCNGEIIPRAPEVETLIEFTHRLSSGLVLVLVAVMIVWAFRLYPKGHLIRKSAGFTVFFTITEALVGAGLVLLGLVADNDSIARAFAMMIHLVNTFLLLAALILTAWWSTFGTPEKLTYKGKKWGYHLVGLAGILVLGASGAVTALGDTLFPATSLVEEFWKDLDPSAHILIRLRIFHPMIAVGVGLYIMRLAAWVRGNSKDPWIRRISAFLIGSYFVQLWIGVINVLLLAPVPVQLVHLLVSDFIWMSAFLLSALVMGAPLFAHSHQYEKVHERVDQAAQKV
jgi:heme A synthase